ncbi:nickel ABC transporter permease subunit NikC [Megalodesulfovibrio paquesii]
MKWLQSRHPVVPLALALLVVLGLAGAFAPVLSPYDPDEVTLALKFAPPTAEHWLGCDHLGRDVLTRLLYGTRVSLGCVAAIAGCICLLGLVVGAVAGFAGGRVDAALMRLCDVFLTFPTFILAMFMVGVLGTGMGNVVLAITLTHWAWYARIIRSLILSLKHREYVLAARVAGSSRLQVLVRHLLPPVAAQLVILATLDIGHMMLHVSGLSFLGLGVTPPTAEWGVMLGDARQFVWTHPELIFYPGAMLFITVMACNLLGDAMRDALDPALREIVAHEHGALEAPACPAPVTAGPASAGNPDGPAQGLAEEPVEVRA